MKCARCGSLKLTELRCGSCGWPERELPLASELLAERGPDGELLPGKDY